MALSLPEQHLKRSMPSLIGGIFSGIVIFVLWLLLAGSTAPATVAVGALVALAVGTWVRLADL